jgi:hypothetical protein
MLCSGAGGYFSEELTTAAEGLLTPFAIVAIG